LVNRLPPLELDAPTPRFDAGRFNLHQHVTQGGPRPPLVVLVHGLGGRGYESWGHLPYHLCSGIGGPPLDVAVYDYRSGLRRVGHRSGGFGFWVDQLAGHVRQVEAQYSNIVLVGHSLGGLLIEAVAVDFLRVRAMQDRGGPSSLAALIFVASPRAGSGWAVPLFRPVLREIAVLRRLSPHSADMDAFFATSVERLNVAVAAPGREILPMYAAVGGSDRLVGRFSAAFSVPTTQRLHLDAGHGSIKNDPHIVRWLHRVISERLEVRAQAARERRHAAHHVATTMPDPRPVVVTSIVSDPSGLRWEELYSKVCRDATTTTVTVQDVREVPGAEVDLLIAVHDADLIVAANPAVRDSVRRVRAERDRHGAMLVGICPVGAEFRKAEATLHQWLAAGPMTTSVYVEGAADTVGLRGVLARLLQVVIDRDPRRAARAALADPGLGGADDLYDPKRGGF
jgi:pimeloyl-ACP methyl ester carboxylesterase